MSDNWQDVKLGQHAKIQTCYLKVANSAKFSPDYYFATYSLTTAL